MILDNVRSLFGTGQVKIGWTTNASNSTIRYVGIDHGRSNITVAKEFLCRADITTGFHYRVGGLYSPPHGDVNFHVHMLREA